MQSFNSLAENPACNVSCRACHYKDLDYPSQLSRKQSWASKQLGGQWADVLAEILPAPEPERLAYRTKSWLRSSVSGGGLSFGMIRAVREGRSWAKEFISWDECPLHTHALNETMARLRAALLREAPGFVENGLVGVWVGSPHLVVISREIDPAPLEALDWREILAEPFSRAWFHCNPETGKKVFGHREIRELTPSDSREEMPAHPIRAFRQVARTLLGQARSRAVSALIEAKPDRVLDLYCGTGDLSLLLPPEMGWLGIEYSREAVKFAAGLRPSGPTHPPHRAWVGGVEQRLQDARVLEQIRGRWALYLNPPRSGLTPDAQGLLLELIERTRPVSIVYLSCSASSLARDLRAFEKTGFSVQSLQPYDFFPQTEHFETLAILTHIRHGLLG